MRRIVAFGTAETWMVASGMQSETLGNRLMVSGTTGVRRVDAGAEDIRNILRCKDSSSGQHMWSCITAAPYRLASWKQR